MEKYVIEIDKDGKETNAHLNPIFPLAVHKTTISNYYHGHLTVHWHQDFELLLILAGRFEYSVNGVNMLLAPGRGIFVNSKRVHTGRQLPDEDCSYIYIRFEPELIGGFEGGRIYEKYFQPIIEADHLPFILLSPEISWQGEILSSLQKIHDIKVSEKPDLELRLLQEIGQMWVVLYNNCEKSVAVGAESSGSARAIKEGLLYIQNHYSEKICLKAISDACNCSKSGCCRIFQKIVGQSPMDYVNTYRIKKSLPLIATGEYSMTEIAYLVGFTGSSYFGEVFKQQMGCSPTEYRKTFVERKQIGSSPMEYPRRKNK